MKKKGVSLFLGTVLVAVMISTLSAQPEEIILNNAKVYEKKQRPPVAFPHEVHMAGALSCTDCHHQYSNGENVLEESELEEGNPDIRCATCHDRETRINIRQAFHRQCMGCHARIQKEGKTSGPRLCGECHIRS